MAGSDDPGWMMTGKDSATGTTDPSGDPSPLEVAEERESDGPALYCWNRFAPELGLPLGSESELAQPQHSSALQKQAPPDIHWSSGSRGPEKSDEIAVAEMCCVVDWQRALLPSELQ